MAPTFEQLAAELRTALLWDARRLRKICPIVLDEEDLVMESLARSLAVWPKLATLENPVAAMRQKCKWAMVDHIRSMRVGKRHGSHIDHDPLPESDDEDADMATPEAYMEAQDTAKRLIGLCKGNAKSVTALESRAAGESTAEIAARSGMSVLQVRQFFARLEYYFHKENAAKLRTT